MRVTDRDSEPTPRSSVISSNLVQVHHGKKMFTEVTVIVCHRQPKCRPPGLPRQRGKRNSGDNTDDKRYEGDENSLPDCEREAKRSCHKRHDPDCEREAKRSCHKRHDPDCEREAKRSCHKRHNPDCEREAKRSCHKRHNPDCERKAKRSCHKRLDPDCEAEAKRSCHRRHDPDCEREAKRSCHKRHDPDCERGGELEGKPPHPHRQQPHHDPRHHSNLGPLAEGCTASSAQAIIFHWRPTNIKSVTNGHTLRYIGEHHDDMAKTRTSMKTFSPDKTVKLSVRPGVPPPPIKWSDVRLVPMVTIVTTHVEPRILVGNLKLTVVDKVRFTDRQTRIRIVDRGNLVMSSTENPGPKHIVIIEVIRQMFRVGIGKDSLQLPTKLTPTVIAHPQITKYQGMLAASLVVVTTARDTKYVVKTAYRWTTTEQKHLVRRLVMRKRVLSLKIAVKVQVPELYFAEPEIISSVKTRHYGLSVAMETNMLRFDLLTKSTKPILIGRTEKNEVVPYIISNTELTNFQHKKFTGARGRHALLLTVNLQTKKVLHREIGRVKGMSTDHKWKPTAVTVSKADVIQGHDTSFPTDDISAKALASFTPKHLSPDQLCHKRHNPDCERKAKRSCHKRLDPDCEAEAKRSCHRRHDPDCEREAKRSCHKRHDPDCEREAKRSCHKRHDPDCEREAKRSCHKRHNPDCEREAKRSCHKRHNPDCERKAKRSCHKRLDPDCEAEAKRSCHRRHDPDCEREAKRSCHKRHDPDCEREAKRSCHKRHDPDCEREAKRSCHKRHNPDCEREAKRSCHKRHNPDCERKAKRSCHKRLDPDCEAEAKRSCHRRHDPDCEREAKRSCHKRHNPDCEREAKRSCHKRHNPDCERKAKRSCHKRLDPDCEAEAKRSCHRRHDPDCERGGELEGKPPHPHRQQPHHDPRHHSNLGPLAEGCTASSAQAIIFHWRPTNIKSVTNGHTLRYIGEHHDDMAKTRTSMKTFSPAQTVKLSVRPGVPPPPIKWSDVRLVPMVTIVTTHVEPRILVGNLKLTVVDKVRFTDRQTRIRIVDRGNLVMSSTENPGPKHIVIIEVIRQMFRVGIGKDSLQLPTKLTPTVIAHPQITKYQGMLAASLVVVTTARDTKYVVKTAYRWTTTEQKHLVRRLVMRKRVLSLKIAVKVQVPELYFAEPEIISSVKTRHYGLSVAMETNMLRFDLLTKSTKPILIGRTEKNEVVPYIISNAELTTFQHKKFTGARGRHALLLTVNLQTKKVLHREIGRVKGISTDHKWKPTAVIVSFRLH
eukprot:sb/3461129/